MEAQVSHERQRYALGKMNTNQYKPVNHFLIISLIFLLLTVQGCAGTGYTKDFIPYMANGWQNVVVPERKPEKYFKYNCQDFSISISDIWISSQLLTIGFILPVIPFPVPMGGDNKAPIKMILEGDYSLPDKDTIHIVINDNDIVKPVNFKNHGHIVEFIFPLINKKIKSFYVVFNEPCTECSIPPLKYERKTNFRGGITNMGP